MLEAQMSQTTVVGGDHDFLDLLRRVRGEFTEMPDLVLTYEEAVRLWACHPAICRAVLETLVESRFLIRTRRAAFVRAA
jgi:hypothetical protein